MHYLYILKSKKNSQLYIGQTDDLRTRFEKHYKGLSMATKAYKPFTLVYYEAYRSKRDAIAREIKLKKFKQGYSRLKQRLTFSLEEQS